MRDLASTRDPLPPSPGLSHAAPDPRHAPTSCSSIFSSRRADGALRACPVPPSRPLREPLLRQDPPFSTSHLLHAGAAPRFPPRVAAALATPAPRPAVPKLTQSHPPTPTLLYPTWGAHHHPQVQLVPCPCQQHAASPAAGTASPTSPPGHPGAHPWVPVGFQPHPQGCGSSLRAGWVPEGSPASLPFFPGPSSTSSQLLSPLLAPPQGPAQRHQLEGWRWTC